MTYSITSEQHQAILAKYNLPYNRLVREKERDKITTVVRSTAWQLVRKKSNTQPERCSARTKMMPVKHNDIELIETKEPRIDNPLVAKEMSITHKSLMNLIRSNKNELREFGSLPFQKASRKRNIGRVTVSYSLLNENQFDLISRLVRGKDYKSIINFKVRVTKAFAAIRQHETVKREYLPYYHESRDSLSKMQHVERYHYITLARAENKIIGVSAGERQQANEIQLGMLICLQQIETSVFKEINSPTEAIREVSRRFNTLAHLISPAQ